MDWSTKLVVIYLIAVLVFKFVKCFYLVLDPRAAMGALAKQRKYEQIGAEKQYRELESIQYKNFLRCIGLVVLILIGAAIYSAYGLIG